MDPDVVERAGLAPAPTGGRLQGWEVMRGIDRLTTRDVRRVYPHLGHRLRTKELWDGQRWHPTAYDIEIMDSSRRVSAAGLSSAVDAREEQASETVREPVIDIPNNIQFTIGIDTSGYDRDRAPTLAEIWADD